MYKPLLVNSLKHFFPFPLNHFQSYRPNAPWRACYRRGGGPMATQKQIQANRSNTQLSTGPRTEQGKAISRRNALKTGIDARNEAASGEDSAVLAALAAQYDHEFQPLGVVERLLVDILIKDDWFLRRYRFLAADLVNHGAAVAYETKRGAD